MNGSRICVRWVLVVLLVAMPGQVYAGDENRQLTKELLSSGWQLGPAGMETVHKLQPRVESSRDAKTAYALGLVLLKHHQYEEAGKAFQMATKFDPSHLKSWRAMIWVYALREKFDVAALQTSKLVKQLPPTELQGLDELPAVETVRMLGRWFAFLEGPRASDVNSSLVARAKLELQPALVGKRGQEFENNYTDVTTLFSASSIENKDAKTDAIQQQQQEQLAAQQQLALRGKQLDVDQLQANDRIDQLRSGWQQEQLALNEAEAPLNASIAQLEAQQRVIRRELSVLVDDIFRLTEELKETENPNRKQRLEREIVRLEILLNQYERDLALVQAEGTRLVQQRNQLRSQRLQTQQRFETDIKNANDRVSDLQRAERRLQLEMKRASKSSTGNTARVRAMNAKASSIRTYIDFPLDVERLQLLEP